MSLLEVRGLGISFKTEGGRTGVVEGVDFRIEEGTVFGLAGESGCGKSLTALSIMTILPRGAEAAGEILFKGRDLLGLRSEDMRMLRGKELSMVFQEPMTSLNPVLTVGYQIRETIETHEGLSKKEAEEKTIGLLRAVRMPSPEMRLREYPHQMSGGMRQRAMIAMAIACSPSLLIADEPTTALDVTIEAQILELIDSLRRERDMAVLLITHDIGIIAEYAERAAVMYAGSIVETSDVSGLLERPAHPYTIGLLESLPGARGVPLKPIPGVVPRPGEMPSGCRFSDRCVHALPKCRREEPALRELAPGHLARCLRAEEIGWRS